MLAKILTDWSYYTFFRHTIVNDIYNTMSMKEFLQSIKDNDNVDKRVFQLLPYIKE